MLIARCESGLDCSSWMDGQSVMDWWIYGKKHEPTKGLQDDTL